MDRQALRDIRDGNWYWIHRAVLRLYGRKLGPAGIAVYNVLASFANSQTQCAFPTQKAMADMLGLSERTVARKVRLLRDLGLIATEKRRGASLYWLLKVPGDQTGDSCEPDAGTSPEPTDGKGNQDDKVKINNNKKSGADVKGEASNGFVPKTREELLALDLAGALNDRRHLSVYLSYAKRYPESLLRGVLGEVEEMPPGSIKKGRAALFHYLLKKRVEKTTDHPGH